MTDYSMPGRLSEDTVVSSEAIVIDAIAWASER